LALHISISVNATPPDAKTYGIQTGMYVMELWVHVASGCDARHFDEKKQTFYLKKQSHGELYLTMVNSLLATYCTPQWFFFHSWCHRPWCHYNIAVTHSKYWRLYFVWTL